MTTEIEKQFFETLGIGKVKRRHCSLDSETHCPTDYITCKDCSHWEETEDELDKYPEITDRKLLLLFCIANAHSVYGYSDYGGEFLIGTTIEELKEHLLKDLIRDGSRVREDIKALFEDKEQ